MMQHFPLAGLTACSLGACSGKSPAQSACPFLDTVNGGLHVTETTVHFCALVVIARFAGMCKSLNSADAVHARQDLGDKTIQCGRRADAFKLWLTWKVGMLQKHALPNMSMF